VRIEAAKAANPAKRAKAAAAELETGERFDADDQAAREAWSKNPDASMNAITALVRKARKCGQTRAWAATSRAKPS
jgi:hypothetical protein